MEVSSEHGMEAQSNLCPCPCLHTHARTDFLTKDTVPRVCLWKFASICWLYLHNMIYKICEIPALFNNANTFFFFFQSSFIGEAFTEMTSCVIRNAIWSKAHASLNAIGVLISSHQRTHLWLLGVSMPMAQATPFSRESLLPEVSLLPQMPRIVCSPWEAGGPQLMND